MARKVTGYIELYWKCPSCSNENMGSHAYCMSCGAPQPKNAGFHQGAKQQLLTDAEKLRRAKAGADIHCGFCGTRNPATGTACAQCGADLKQGSKRSAGKVLGAFSEGAVEPVACANCGTMNAGTRMKCGNCGSALSHAAKPAKAAAPVAAQPMDPKMLWIGGGVLLFLCAIIYFLFLRTNNIVGTVTNTSWQTSVVIEAYGPVHGEDWLEALPAGAWDVSCSLELSSVESQPPASGNYEEVCGTPYTVDTGGGYAEVVQDCEYQVYEDYCSYTIDTWSTVDTVELQGFGLQAEMPSSTILMSNQRFGAEQAIYECIFEANGSSYSYQTDSWQQYQRCVQGSRWNLEVNSLGSVVSISPAN
jgi:hypothetical protein